MEKWLSALSPKVDVAIALYARFPTEMAYGNHVIQIAKAFSKNNCNVNIYYPKTYNSKTLKETPEQYYGQIKNVNYVMVNNTDLTSYKIYELLPSIIQKVLFSLSTFIWARKLKNNQGEKIIWSTNPNILYIAHKFFNKIIYEKHGEAKYIQKFSITKIKKNKNALMVGVTKESFNELSDSINQALYLPNGVDEDVFKVVNVNKNKNITIGYLGMLETYGVDKGVLESIRKIDELNNKYFLNTKVIGGPEHKLQEIKNYLDASEFKDRFSINPVVPHKEVPHLLNQFDIGIVPYPDNQHMTKYASPMKIFEMAACGVPILASDIDSHKELGDLELGIIYFEHNNFYDFSKKLEELITNDSLRNELSSKSLLSIKKLFWSKRIHTILESARSSTG